MTTSKSRRPSKKLILLSPAKSLDFETPGPLKKGGVPRFLANQTAELAGILRKKSALEIADLMDLSDRLAQLNFQRYQTFDQTVIQKQSKKRAVMAGKEGSPLPAKHALWAFTGDVYQGFDAISLKAKGIERAQDSIRILSGLYGFLKPLDLMMPYRLEMGTKLESANGKDLYQFWGSAISEGLDRERPDWICNLASKEYYKSVHEGELSCPVIHPVFKDESKGAFKVVALFTKHTRGLMARWIIDNKVCNPDKLRNFSVGGYKYSKSDSTDLQPVFTRSASSR